ncbi:ClbS/DfsB family four-helix bundle protein [Aquimarina sediminis]|uniref:ClbS/DfsB family four-helix bundle protein n=1 Tax=Aquimarina sediminis TaxID=2070536 RepID=UPI000CA03A47|nr:ClbS/DfsB family four-helix bundle protein [Aquimarina sediminis]
MPRPKSKEELVELSQKNYDKLLELVASYSKEEIEKEFPPGTLNRNIKDVLAHLHKWHLMMLDWYTIGMAGKKPDMPAKGYTWKTLPELNRKIQEEYQDMQIDKARELLDCSYLDIQKLIQKHTNEELFEKKRYKWTGSTSLGAYLISNTSSHYDWAFKLIKKSIK